MGPIGQTIREGLRHHGLQVFGGCIAIALVVIGGLALHKALHTQANMPALFAKMKLEGGITMTAIGSLTLILGIVLLVRQSLSKKRSDVKEQREEAIAPALSVEPAASAQGAYSSLEEELRDALQRIKAMHGPAKRDYYVRFKRKLLLFLRESVGAEFKKVEVALQDQLLSLMDRAFIAETSEDENRVLRRLSALLDNPIEWTKEHGEGLAQFMDAKEKGLTGPNRIRELMTNWRDQVRERCPSEHPNTSEELKRNFRQKVVDATFNEVQEVPVLTCLDDITATKLWDLREGEELLFSDRAFYNKGSDYITFETVERRTTYMTPSADCPRIYDRDKHTTADWKFVIFVQPESLERAWDGLRDIIFADNSPVECGKIARMVDGKTIENNVAQIVLYTFDDKLSAEDVERWQETIQLIENRLAEADVKALRTEDGLPRAQFSQREKYPVIEGARYCHTTLDRLKIVESINRVQNFTENLYYTLRSGKKIVLGYNPEKEGETRSFCLTAAHFQDIVESGEDINTILEHSTPLPTPLKHLRVVQRAS